MSGIVVFNCFRNLSEKLESAHSLTIKKTSWTLVLQKGFRVAIHYYILEGKHFVLIHYKRS